MHRSALTLLRGLLLPVLMLCAIVLSPSRASAQVVITFYSHDLDDHFPHAFFTLKGKRIDDGTEVDTNFGFTPKKITPAMLFGSVDGRIDIAEPRYVAHSTAHFSLTLNDAQYDQLLAHVEKWRTAPNPSYNLNRANCVHFVGEAARAIGLKVSFPQKLMKKPRSYIDEIMRLNPQLVDLRLERKNSKVRNAAVR